MNPNSSAETTWRMVTNARRFLPAVDGWTAPRGPALLSDPAKLAASAQLVAQAKIPADVNGVIISAFGDPGKAALGARLAIPVVGIGESAAMAAAQGGRAYAVVTHTPQLVASINALMRSAAPHGTFLGTFLTQGDPVDLSQDEARLDAGLSEAAYRAHAAGADAVIIGGGPLGDAAERLRDTLPCTLIAPIPEAAKRLRACLIAAGFKGLEPRP
jgi:Asp/Glu/hydantoin racemase